MSSSLQRRRFRRGAVAVLFALLAVATAVVVAVALMKPARSEPTSAPITYKPIEAPFVPQLLIIGDSFTGGSDMGGVGENGWPVLVQSAATHDGSRLQVNVMGKGGAGYVTKGLDKQTISEAYAAKPYAGQDVVVVFAGLNDSTQPAERVGAGATSLYADLKKQSPKASLIVVGPAWPNAEPTPNMLEVRNSIKASALAAGASFVDPIAEGWFTGKAESLIGADRTHPTNDGHKYLADKLGPRIIPVVHKVAAANK